MTYSNSSIYTDWIHLSRRNFFLAANLCVLNFILVLDTGLISVLQDESFRPLLVPCYATGIHHKINFDKNNPFQPIGIHSNANIRHHKRFPSCYQYAFISKLSIFLFWSFFGVGFQLFRESNEHSCISQYTNGWLAARTASAIEFKSVLLRLCSVEFRPTDDLLG